MHRNDPADYWDALPSPLIRRFLSTAGTSEFGHFQKTHEFPRQRHPPVAYAWERELAVVEVVGPRRRPGGAVSPLTLLTTSGLCPGFAALESTPKASKSHDWHPPRGGRCSVSSVSSVSQSVSSVQSVGLRIPPPLREPGFCEPPKTSYNRSLNGAVPSNFESKQAVCFHSQR